MKWMILPCKYNLRPVNHTTYEIPSSIAFGSCQDNWISHRVINKVQADVFIYLGDNIYGDDGTDIISWFPSHWMWYRKILYNKLSCRRSFQNMVERTPYIISTWDDHDYGANDDKYQNPIKQESRSAFLDFWRIPKNSMRRRPNGIYGSYRFESTRQSILILVLDMRWFNKFNPNSALGDEQLHWIKTTLNEKANDLVIVASSLQFANNCSDEFHNDRAALTRILNPSNTIFISGDVHYAGIFKSPEGFLDITSSPLAMNYPWNPIPPPSDGKQCAATGDTFNEENYGVLDIRTQTAYVFGMDGPLLTHKWAN